MDYLAPTTLKEVLALLKKPRAGACIVAGGTDVLPRVSTGKAKRPKQLVSLRQVPGLDKMSVEGKGVLRIGALVSLADVASSKQVVRRSAALAEAASWVGSEQIRTTATLVGNLCSASSAADTIPPLLCAEAVLEVAGPKGRRRMPVANLLSGPRKLSLKAGEMVLAVRLPSPTVKSGSVYRRHGPRHAMDCAVVIAAAQLTLKKGKISDARIAVGAVHAIPVRLPKAEKLLLGQPLSDELLGKVGATAAASVEPITDIRATADHRVAVTERLVPQVVAEAFERAGGQR